MARVTQSVCGVRFGVFLALGFLLWALVQASETTADDRAGGTARKILDASNVKGGLIVHLGCGDGRLTAALRADERYVVRGVDVNPANVDAARQNIDARGIYGPVSVECFRESALPFADNLVNLLVVSKNEARVSQREILRALAPEGLALIAESDDPQSGDEQAAPARQVIIDGQPWIMFRKPWPADIDQWTHWLHGADGNPVARDTVVGPPRQI